MNVVMPPAARRVQAFSRNAPELRVFRKSCGSAELSEPVPIDLWI